MSPPTGLPLRPRLFPILLYASSALWLVAGAFPPPGTSDSDCLLLLLAITLPILAGMIIARIPWNNDQSEPDPVIRVILRGALFLIGFLWLTFSLVFLGFFFLITFTTGWE